MNYKDFGRANQERFAKLEGSEYIASYFAIQTILRLIDKYDIKNVLELGLGIGSISDTVLRYAKATNRTISYTGTELNEFCLNALKENVRDYNKIDLHSELKTVSGKKFDFIIIDGYDESLKQIVSYCTPNALIFIEGDRHMQTQNLIEYFPNARHVNIITLDKYYPNPDSPRYVGGGQLIFVNPTPSMKLFWLGQKIGTYIKRKRRTYK